MKNFTWNSIYKFNNKIKITMKFSQINISIKKDSNFKPHMMHKLI